MSLLPFIVSFSDNDLGHDPWSHPMYQFMAPINDKRTCVGHQKKKSPLKKTHASPCQHQMCPMRDQIPAMGKDGFQFSVDVHQFAPNEISVKTVDHYVVIEANHEEKQEDQGFVSRHYTRRIMLPKECDVQRVVSSLSSDGFLIVKAPPATPKDIDERVVQIQQTGPAHISVRQNEVKQGEKDLKEVEAKIGKVKLDN